MAFWHVRMVYHGVLDDIGNKILEETIARSPDGVRISDVVLAEQQTLELVVHLEREDAPAAAFIAAQVFTAPVASISALELAYAEIVNDTDYQARMSSEVRT